MTATRVLVVWGSETNQTKIAMTDLVEEWQQTHDTKTVTFEFLMGDKAATDEKFATITSDNYDYVVIGTSSYGEGDPPSGFGKFLYQLQEAAAAANANQETPPQFAGLQHAVLGFGSTAYETFQNCPRMVDKYFGEAGSRRCLQRFEWDEMEHDMDDVTKWSKELQKLLLLDPSTVSTEPPVCAWTEPEAQLLAKPMDADGYEKGQGEMSTEKRLLIPILVASAGVAYYWYQYKLQNITLATLDE